MAARLLWFITTYSDRDKWPYFCKRYFPYRFLFHSWTLLHICSTFIIFFLKGSFDNNSAVVQIMTWRSKRQTIIRTNDGLVYWRIYESLSLNELTRKSSNQICMMKFTFWRVSFWLGIRRNNPFSNPSRTNTHCSYARTPTKPTALFRIARVISPKHSQYPQYIFSFTRLNCEQNFSNIGINELSWTCLFLLWNEYTIHLYFPIYNAENNAENMLLF